MGASRPRSSSLERRAFLIGCAICLFAGGASSGGHTLVVNHGRVMDPETSLDAIRHIGIDGGRIARISEAPLEGDREIDASVS